jgi:hypothetical protein
MNANAATLCFQKQRMNCSTAVLYWGAGGIELKHSLSTAAG